MSGPAASLRIAVGSKNPVKVNAVKCGVERALNGVSLSVLGLEAPSGVSEQPMGDEETLQGAINRAKNAYALYTESNGGSTPDFSVGLEGGVHLTRDPFQGDGDQEVLECFAWIAIYNGSRVSKARTGTFILPRAIRDMVLNEGLELGDADDRYSSKYL